MTREYDKLNSSCKGTRIIITFINAKKGINGKYYNKKVRTKS